MIYEKPILFNTEMIRAVLDGRKTQTRRVIKFEKLSNIKKGRLFYSKTFDSWAIEGGEAHITLVKCPYGKTGDQLWVRETFLNCTMCKKHIYKATSIESRFGKDFTRCPACGFNNLRWKPSIFMPRKLSRIQLKIKVRVEQLQDISEEDAQLEGLFFIDYGLDEWGQQKRGWNVKSIAEKGSDHCLTTARYGFANLWDKINSNRKDKDGNILPYSWNDNPHVWVVEFEVINKNNN